jgi:hypothetical protein
MKKIIIERKQRIEEMRSEYIAKLKEEHNLTDEDEWLVNKVIDYILKEETI